MAEEEGTRSILDILSIPAQPQIFAAAPLAAGELQECFGVDKPTTEMVEESGRLWDIVERGMARYVITYEGALPSKILFAGYSFD